jgi:hypothetical protein
MKSKSFLFYTSLYFKGGKKILVSHTDFLILPLTFDHKYYEVLVGNI